MPVEAVRRRARFMVQLQAWVEKRGRTAKPLYPVVRAAAEAFTVYGCIFTTGRAG